MRPPAPRIQFKPVDRSLYGRAIELAVLGRHAKDPLPLTAADLADALEEARVEGAEEGWYKARKGARSNPWDLAYEFATRRALPPTVAEYGYTGVRIAEAGDGYLLTRGVSPRVVLPDPATVPETLVRDLVPEA